MDKCNHCNGYHSEVDVCDGYINKVRDGKIMSKPREYKVITWIQGYPALIEKSAFDELANSYANFVEKTDEFKAKADKMAEALESIKATTQGNNPIFNSKMRLEHIWSNAEQALKEYKDGK